MSLQIPESKIASEELLNEKWDFIASNALVRSGLGLSVGIAASVLLFRRRTWPVFTGLGFGAGQAWNDADRVLNPSIAPGFTIKNQTPL
ncbi:Mitochondrial inner membrane organizing system component [Saitoella coloradoensis]